MTNPQRIHFLDFSRSVAILMMLQGHFISMTLESYPHFMAEVRLNGHSGNIWFSIWGFFRGLTAPLFFTISGAVFTFLLHKEWQKNQGSFFQLVRTRKGVKRALSLLAIGYLLQINLKYLKYYLAGHFNPHFLGFHILQCIGVGLLLLLLFSALLHKIKIIQLDSLHFVSCNNFRANANCTHAARFFTTRCASVYTEYDTGAGYRIFNLPLD